MSAPLAGKFQDHYEVLGIEPNSKTETIQKAYTTLAKKYHPKTPDTGNEEKFKAVNLAFEVLSDPILRTTFDSMRPGATEGDTPKFSGPSFFESLFNEAGRRCAILCVLYDRRQQKPFTPSLSMRNLENMLHGNTEELNLAIWYLKQKNLMMSDDKSSFQITIEGIEYLETNRPSADQIMPFLKPPAPPKEKPQTVPAQKAKVEEPATSDSGNLPPELPPDLSTADLDKLAEALFASANQPVA